MMPLPHYDVAPGGKAFVMLRCSPSSHRVAIQNVPALMRRMQGGAG